jgi:hypothetical protein
LKFPAIPHSSEARVLVLKRKMMNHNGSEADMDELLTNPESKHPEYTENERVMGVIERTLPMR